MPRYFFDVHDDKDMPDDTGTDLPDFGAVREQAIRFAAEVLRDLDGALVGDDWSMTVRDEAGDQVMTVRFSATEHGGDRG